jgi:hypothetical protein
MMVSCAAGRQRRWGSKIWQNVIEQGWIHHPRQASSAEKLEIQVKHTHWKWQTAEKAALRKASRGNKVFCAQQPFLQRAMMAA